MQRQNTPKASNSQNGHSKGLSKMQTKTPEEETEQKQRRRV